MSRIRLDKLAQRIEATAGWNDLTLPERQLATLRATAREFQRNKPRGPAGQRARGAWVLFTGPNGTGKTMAAQVLARELGLDLYRIDLSDVISKYIGETEKHLDRIFEAAENSEALLFFDEADALFGKRTEVRDSHDRYLNIEINYLLQRMEASQSLVILATNAKGSLPDAVLRRIRRAVHFC